MTWYRCGIHDFRYNVDSSLSFSQVHCPLCDLEAEKRRRAWRQMPVGKRLRKMRINRQLSEEGLEKARAILLYTDESQEHIQQKYVQSFTAARAAEDEEDAEYLFGTYTEHGTTRTQIAAMDLA